MNRTLPICFVAAAASLSTAQQQYTDEAAFDAAISALGGSAVVYSDALNAPVTPNVPGVDTVTTTAQRLRFISDPADPGEIGIAEIPLNGAFATSSPRYLYVFDLDQDGHKLTLELAYPVRGIAFKITDFGDVPSDTTGPLIATAYNGSEATGTITFAAVTAFDNRPSGNEQFFGYIGAPGEVFSRIVFEHGNPNEGYGLDDIRLLAADNLERALLIADPDKPITIDSTGSRGVTADINTGVALWNDAGTLIASDKVSGPLGAGKINLFEGLPTGWYVAAVAPGNRTFGDAFAVNGSGTVPVNAAVSIAGRTFAPRSIPADGEAYFEFIVSDPGDHILPTGPEPAVDLGLIPSGQITISQTTIPSWIAIFNRDTGELITTTNSGLTTTLPGPARYLLILAGEATVSQPKPGQPAGSPFGDNFHIAADTASRTVTQFTFNNYNSPFLGFGSSEIAVYNFEVGDFPAEADLNKDGQVDFFDVLLFLTLIESALP